MKIAFDALEPQDIQFEAKISMSLSEWNKVRGALDKGKDGFYGPPRWVIEAIDQMVRKAESSFGMESAE